MKEMCKLLPHGACPNCGNSQFVVAESSCNLYLTSKYGEIIDSKEEAYNAVGKCCKCGKVYPMEPTNLGFIPMTPLKRWFYDIELYRPNIEEIDYTSIPNPMEKEK